jgi:hypothetical protein
MTIEAGIHPPCQTRLFIPAGNENDLVGVTRHAQCGPFAKKSLGPD